MKKKLFIVGIVWGVQTLLCHMTDFIVSRPAAGACLAQLNGGDGEAAKLAALVRLPSIVYLVVALMNIAFIAVLFKRERKQLMKKIKSIIGLVLIMTVAGSMTGCRRPYDEPEFKVIGPNQTAFLIQARGDSSNQDRFKSAELLQKNMVAAKKIQIAHEWVQTGRRGWQGKWEPTHFLYTVNRAPVTRVWDKSPSSGTSTRDDSLTAESLDSLFVSSGFTLTAYIEPEDTALFLYKYKGDSLASVMDTQIKNSIQTVFTTECAKYGLVDLPKHKSDIMQAIRERVISFYKGWGITLAADMGFVGGLTYSPDIQSEIDSVFKAEKAKERACADLEAQNIVNQKLKAEAVNKAEMAKIEADGEAYAIQKRADAINQAGEIYIKARYIEKWNGIEPKVKGGGMTSLLDVSSML